MSKKPFAIPRFSPSRLKHVRESRKLTRYSLGLQSGLSVSHVYQLEAGAKVPTEETTRKLAGVLDCDLGDLYDVSGKSA